MQAESPPATYRLDTLLIAHPANVRYLCGFTGSAGAVILSESRSVFFTDGRYKEQAKIEVQGSRVAVASKSPLAAAAEWLVGGTRRSWA